MQFTHSLGQEGVKFALKNAFEKGQVPHAQCFIDHENQEQTAWFLDENPNFRLDGEKIHFPSESAFDGFYMVRLVKEEKE